MKTTIGYINYKLFLVITLIFSNYAFVVASGILEINENLVRYLSVLLMIYFFIMNRKVNLIEFVVCFFIIFISLIIYSYTYNLYLFNFVFIVIFLIFFNSLDISFESVIETLFYCSLVVFILYFLLYFSGYVDHSITYFGGRERNSFGMANPNQLGLMIYNLLIISSVRALFFKRSKIFTLLIFLVGLYLILKSDSRTPLFSMLIFFIWFFCIRLKINVRRYFVLFLIFMTFILILLAINLSMTQIDRILSYRLFYLNEFFSSVSFFDFIFGMAIGKKEALDNSFALIFFSYGFLASLFISFSFIFSSSQRVPITISSFFISVLCYATFESLLARPELPVTLLFFLVLQKTNLFYKSDS